MKIKLKIMIGIFATLLCSAVSLRVYADSNELHQAVKDGNMYEIERLCEENASLVDEGDDEGRTPLHVAASRGNLPAVRYLIDVMHVDVNQKNKSPKFKVLTSLYYAIYSGNLDLVKYLILLGVNVINEEGMHDFDALPIAMRAGFKPIVEYFVNRVHFPEGSVDYNNLLCHAVHSGKLEMVKYAVEVLHADVNKATDTKGNTCLQLALNLELGDIIEYLVAQNAKLGGLRIPHKTSLHNIVKCGSADLVAWWMHIPNLPNFPLLQLNCGDDKGRTPLHYAIRSGNLDTVKYFVEKCPMNLAVMDKDRKGLLYTAIEHENPDAFWYLVGHRAPIGGESTEGKTSLTLALEKGYTGAAEYLITKNINVKTADISKKTPLHIALEKGFFSTAKSLVAHGADVNAADYLGVTPLGLAISAKSFNMVRYLVEHGADVNLNAGYQGPPIFCVIGTGRLDILDYLVKKGANILAKDCYGRSLMYNAQLYNDLGMVVHLRREYGMSEEVLGRDFDVEDPLGGNIFGGDPLYGEPLGEDPFDGGFLGESPTKRARFGIFGTND